jgi:uncharacterized protein YbbC (DUF1343 family)
MIGLGVDLFFEEWVGKYKNKRVGLLTNITGVNARLQPTIDLFFEHPEIDLICLFSPEHGIRGDAKEGEKVASGVDPYTGLPVFSLYGETRKPTKDMLESLDVVVVDLQDIGARYYTFIYTVANMMEACKTMDIEVVILDRPNPIGGLKREGNLVKEDFHSFVGQYPLPNRHGLTIGELALVFQREFGLDCSLSIISMSGWKRFMYFVDTGLQWVPPSPNSTGQIMSLLYPGTCLIEGTNLSEGRGTTRPFEIVGAPFINGYELAKRLNEKQLEGIIARPTSFIPTYQKYKDEWCAGVQLHVMDIRRVNSYRTGLVLLETISELYGEALEFRDPDNKRSPFNLLAGTDKLQRLIREHRVEEYLSDCEREIQDFNEMIKPYLIYK